MEQPPVPPPNPATPVTAPQRCGLATASLVLGILSICLLVPCTIPDLHYSGADVLQSMCSLLGLLGVICAIIADFRVSG